MEEERELFKKYMVDIRNLKCLNDEMLNNILKMKDENKLEILRAYNDVTEAYKLFIEAMEKRLIS
jgi:hypothetical protein